jgi:tartrate dehydrogenase/decarboxylase / D-malate dehydrogenase
MMLDHLGLTEAGADVVTAIEQVLGDPTAPRTPDLGGTATTEDLGKAIAEAING